MEKQTGPRYERERKKEKERVARHSVDGPSPSLMYCKHRPTCLHRPVFTSERHRPTRSYISLPTTPSISTYEHTLTTSCHHHHDGRELDGWLKLLGELGGACLLGACVVRRTEAALVKCGVIRFVPCPAAAPVKSPTACPRRESVRRCFQLLFFLLSIIHDRAGRELRAEYPANLQKEKLLHHHLE
jgi:hypothetical protein